MNNPVSGIPKEEDVRTYLLKRGIAAFQRLGGAIPACSEDLKGRDIPYTAHPLPIMYDLLWVNQVTKFIPEVTPHMLIACWVSLTSLVASWDQRVNHPLITDKDVRLLYRATILLGLLSYKERLFFDCTEEIRKMERPRHYYEARRVLLYQLISKHYSMGTAPNSILTPLFEVFLFGPRQMQGKPISTGDRIQKDLRIVIELEQTASQLNNPYFLSRFINHHVTHAFFIRPPKAPLFSTEYLR